MKNLLVKPGFEFIFSLSLMVVLGLPPMLLAQEKKNVDIQIMNGDTTVNDKNIKQLSAKDRQEALKDISHLNQAPANTGIVPDRNSKKMYSFRRDSSGSRSFGMEYRRDKGNNDGMMRPGKRFDRKNTQSFEYVNTDNEGISTHLRFHVSDITNDDLKKMPYVEGGKFEITDLELVPQFDTGKTLLMFDLPAKAAANVQLTDSEGKTLWTEKTVTGNFRKSFALGLNGIYYLQVQQGRNIAIKKIMKEE